MPRSRNWMWGAVLLLGLGLVACGDSAEPGSSGPESESASESETESEAESELESESESEPQSESEAEALFIGTSTCEDPPNDIADDKGSPVPMDAGVPSGTDLTNVALESDGEILLITFTMTQPPPADSAMVSPRELRWVVEVLPEDRRVAVEVLLQGTTFSAAVSEPAADLFGFELTTPELSGNQITVEVPITNSGVETFDWSAYTEWYPLEGQAGRLDDRCPSDFGQEISVS